jgi:type II secretory pathway pseudopilin PulG
MLVVALIGLLSVLVIPSFIKARKQSQGKRIVNDARIIDMAVNSWALEKSKTDGSSVDVDEAAQYAKGGVIQTNDVLGNPFQIGPVGPTQVVISSTTRNALAGVGIDWGPY